MKQKLLLCSKELLNIHVKIPESFYHEHLESILEVAVILKYTKEQKLEPFINQIESLIENLRNSLNLYMEDTSNYLHEENLNLAINNIYDMLQNLHKSLGFYTEYENKTR